MPGCEEFAPNKLLSLYFNDIYYPKFQFCFSIA